MTREELKKKIEKIIWIDNDCHDNTFDDLIKLIDEYTKPKTKTKTLEERKYSFRDKIFSLLHQNQECFHTDMVIDFIDYWTEHNEGGKKMRFEMSKNQPFNIKRRLATWKKNQKNYGTTTTKKGIDSDSLDGWINS